VRTFCRGICDTSPALVCQVSNQAYQEIVRQRHFDNFGSQWYVPTEARRHRTDFEVALASQLAPSPEEAAVFGMQDHYGLSEHEQEVSRMKSILKTL